MKLYKENNETIPAIKVLSDIEAAPAGYTEIVDIVEAYNEGMKAISPEKAGWCDKLSFRSKIKTMVYTKMVIVVPADVDDQTKWDLLTAAEKQIAAELFLIVKESFFLEVVNDLRHWTLEAGHYRHWTTEARNHRAKLAESILFMRMLNLSEAKLVLSDLNQIALDTVIDIDDITKKVKGKVKVKKLNDMYIEGLEDEENDGVVAVRDWINSEVGTPYETNGFMNLGYAFKGTHTSATVRDELITALDGTF